MSSIGSNPHLNLGALGPIDGQRALDDLQARQQAPQSVEGLHGPERAGDAGAAGLAADLDAGERLLQADAWEGLPEGSRFLSGDADFESALGALELSAAADLAVDTVFGAFDALA